MDEWAALFWLSFWDFRGRGHAVTGDDEREWVVPNSAPNRLVGAR